MFFVDNREISLESRENPKTMKTLPRPYRGMLCRREVGGRRDVWYHFFCFAGWKGC
jgi:hypothetical protein